MRKLLDAGRLLPLPLGQGQTRRVALYLMFGRADDIGPATRELAGLLVEEAAQGG